MIDFFNRPELKGLYVGKPKRLRNAEGRELHSGIFKLPTEEATLRREGFEGDGVANMKNHGGLDRAVCIYGLEHYRQWNREYRTQLSEASFGENLLAENMEEENVHIGDVFQVGEAVIQITMGRIPCDTINKRTGIPTLMKRFMETSHTGFLCRVLEEGVVRQDSAIKKVEEDPQRISVFYANSIYFNNPEFIEGMENVVAVPALAEDWRRRFEKRIAKARLAD
ncbi:MOSC domain-containing protein [Planococcus lenghuensis]|uniref:MOSC domain-containing protein n=1 Tax=Planococcus lenghuensis TaxID=2213202 RepID=A0A1Q2KUH6_9BACL|nr:MOSC domain-containing protein [Planococcus lenghuensis]AQQ51860.1 MOSC domain-containing protein [Planococcus lenghuensis]